MKEIRAIILMESKLNFGRNAKADVENSSAAESENELEIL